MSESVADPVALQRDTQSRPPPRPRKRRQPSGPTDDTQHAEKRYIGGLSNFDRVSDIMEYMRSRHRWGTTDFTRNMVTAEPINSTAYNVKNRRVKHLYDALEQAEVLHAITESKEIPKPPRFGRKKLIKTIHAEIAALGKIPGGFPTYHPTTSPAEMELSKIQETIREHAPELVELLQDLMGPSSSDSMDVITMIISMIAYQQAPRTYNQFSFHLGIYLHSLGAKRRALSTLAGLGVIPSYTTIARKYDDLIKLGKVTSLCGRIILLQPFSVYSTNANIFLQNQIREIAQTHVRDIIICWDNFDYNQTVRHQTLREPSKHFCATTGKLCVGLDIPPGGLKQEMCNLSIELQPFDVLCADGNANDAILYQQQQYWITEAIRYCYPEAVNHIFEKLPNIQPQFPTINRIKPHITAHRSLGPILENEGTTDGTYAVLDEVMLHQLKLDRSAAFNGSLYLVYGDQKTVSLILSVKNERHDATQEYDKYSSVLPIPGLFHWRMNLMDMIHDLYTGSEFAGTGSTLHHNRNVLGVVQGHKSPFHHKEEVAQRAFDARILGLFYALLPDSVSPEDPNKVDLYIRQSQATGFLKKIEQIQQTIFTLDYQSPPKTKASELIDHEISSHAKFLQQMEVYKTLKFAIKRGDTGILRRTFPRCALLFAGASKTKYADLSLYMTWLTQTPATEPALQQAILSNSLVNLRGKPDSFFEIDRLNEFFNLQMKTIMATRRTSTLDVTSLFQRTALSASYCTDLQQAIESAFGEYSNANHTNKDARYEVQSLAYTLFNQKSTIHLQNGRAPSTTADWPLDIISKGSRAISNCIERFNTRMVHGQINKDDDQDDQDDQLEQTTTSISCLNDYIDENNPGN